MQTRLNSYDEEEPGEKVEPILPLHAVWNKHKEIKLNNCKTSCQSYRKHRSLIINPPIHYKKHLKAGILIEGRH